MKSFARAFGSLARVTFVRWLHCIRCGRMPCENAHTKTGGTGRRGGYTSIVPLCASCHRLQHQRGWSALFPDHAHDMETFLAAHAKNIQRLWTHANVRAMSP